jgi:hypothetical protein
MQFFSNLLPVRDEEHCILATEADDRANVHADGKRPVRRPADHSFLHSAYAQSCTRKRKDAVR